MSKTVKQIADELGVTKQAVHQKRKSKALSTALQPFTTTVDGVVYISVDGEKLIKSAFMENSRQSVYGSFTSTDRKRDNDLFTVLKATIDTLQEQLIIKDKQLKEKDNQIEKLQNALIKEQENAKMAQQLHGADKVKMLSNETSKKHWWKFKK